MDNQIFDKRAGPALCDSDNVVSLIDSEEKKISGKFVIVSKAWPPVFKCSDVPAALCVPDFKQVVDRWRIVGREPSYTIAGRPIGLGDCFS